MGVMLCPTCHGDKIYQPSGVEEIYRCPECQGNGSVISITYKCPHCGWQFEGGLTDSPLVPVHDYPVPCRTVCPGSKQAPRSLADRRPLWKDETA